MQGVQLFNDRLNSNAHKKAHWAKPNLLQLHCMARKPQTGGSLV